MKIIHTNLEGVVEIVPKRHKDARGYFSEIYKENWFKEYVGRYDFVQENQSVSDKIGTVRGLHFQSPPAAQGKLVRCITGSLFDVAVDIRVGSPTFGQWVSAELSQENGHQLWVPPGFAHGFCTLRQNTTICYKVTAYYDPECDLGVAWDDEDIGINWPSECDASLLSDKDLNQPRLGSSPSYFKM